MYCRVNCTCKLTEKKGWKIENIWPQVWTPIYLQLAGLQRDMPAMADQYQGVIQVTYLPYNYYTNNLKTCFMFSDLWSDAKFYRKGNISPGYLLHYSCLKYKKNSLILNYKNTNFKSSNLNAVHSFPILVLYNVLYNIFFSFIYFMYCRLILQ
jgi:hypothetical protein